jgi:hypothetical protein
LNFSEKNWKLKAFQVTINGRSSAFKYSNTKEESNITLTLMFKQSVTKHAFATGTMI